MDWSHEDIGELSAGLDTAAIIQAHRQSCHEIRQMARQLQGAYRQLQGASRQLQEARAANAAKDESMAHLSRLLADAQMQRLQRS